MREREEAERRKLKNMIMGGSGNDGAAGGPSSAQKRKRGGAGAAGGEDDDDDADAGPPKVLRITRTFTNEQGKEYTRTELVRKPLVIEAYVRVRETKVSKKKRKITKHGDTNFCCIAG